MSTMLILYHRDDDVSVCDLAAALAEMPDIRIERTGPASLVVWAHGWPIRVHVEKGGQVAMEAREIATFAHPASRPDRGAIETCDCRLAVSYEPDSDMLAFNTWLWTIERLYPLMRGIVFDPVDTTFPYHAT